MQHQGTAMYKAAYRKSLCDADKLVGTGWWHSQQWRVQRISGLQGAWYPRLQGRQLRLKRIKPL